MYSECPFCNRRLEGSPINKREASMLRSTYKLYYSLLVPIPFVGSYVGGKIYDFISSPDEWYYRFACPNCRCSWTSTNSDSEIKIGGNRHLVTFFYRNSFVIGSIENDCYLMQTEEKGSTKATVVSKADTLVIEKYDNGHSLTTETTFGRATISLGFYLGELRSGIPNGWGVCFMNNGFIWYGKWQNGMRDGIGYECDFDGDDYRVGFWQKNNFII